jgi:hypothetical protein
MLVVSRMRVVSRVRVVSPVPAMRRRMLAMLRVFLGSSPVVTVVSGGLVRRSL